MLEDAVLEVTAAEKKKFSKPNAQSFTKTKQKLKKYLAESGDDENLFEVQVAKFRENPVEDESEKKEKKAKKESKKKESSDDDSDESDDSDDSDDSSSDEESGEEKPAAKKDEKKKAKDSSSSDESSSSSSNSDSDSDGSKASAKDDSDSEENENEFVEGTKIPKKYEFLLLPREKMTPEQRRWKWVRLDAMPDDLKPLISVGAKQKEDKDDKEEKKKVVKVKDENAKSDDED